MLFGVRYHEVLVFNSILTKETLTHYNNPGVLLINPVLANVNYNMRIKLSKKLYFPQ